MADGPESASDREFVRAIRVSGLTAPPERCPLSSSGKVDFSGILISTYDTPRLADDENELRRFSQCLTARGWLAKYFSPLILTGF